MTCIGAWYGLLVAQRGGLGCWVAYAVTCVKHMGVFDLRQLVGNRTLSSIINGLEVESNGRSSRGPGAMGMSLLCMPWGRLPLYRKGGINFGGVAIMDEECLLSRWSQVAIGGNTTWS